MNSNLPILYSFIRCPYAIRARIALIEANINCILREMNLNNNIKDKASVRLHLSMKTLGQTVKC